MDDIKKAFIKSHYRVHESDQELSDYINKIFLKAYSAQLKRKNNQIVESPILGDFVPVTRGECVRYLLREIDSRTTTTNNNNRYNVEGKDDYDGR